MKDPYVELLHDQLIIRGSLTRETVEDRVTRCERYLSSLPLSLRSLLINFSGVTDCDSTSLAFLTALCRMGKQRQIEIKLVGLPGKMVALARVCEVDKVLPMGE